MAGLLGLVPGTYTALLHQPHGRKIEPLPRPRTAPLANPQPPLVGPAAPLRQVQPHRLAVSPRRIKVAWVTRAYPQDTRRRHTHHLTLRLEDRMPRGQLTQPPLRAIRPLPSGQPPLGVLLDLTLLPGTGANTDTRPRAGQQLLDLRRRQQRTTPAGQLRRGVRVLGQRLGTPITLQDPQQRP